MLTPDDIKGRSFLVSLRGFDRDEVRAFLRQVADEVGALQRRLDAARSAGSSAEEAAGREAQLRAELETARSELADLRAALDAARAAPAAAQPEGQERFARIGQETQRILEAAQQAADTMRLEAEHDTAALRRQAAADAEAQASAAREEAERLRREAEEAAAREVKQARRQADKLIAEGERRREQIESALAELEARRETLATSLRGVGRNLEQSLRELTLPEETTATVREALAAEARAEAQAQARAMAQPAAQESQPDVAALAEPEAAAQPAQDVEPDAVVLDGAAPLAQAESAQAESAQAESAQAEPAQAESALAESAQAVPADPGENGQPGQARIRALTPLHPKTVRKVKRGLQDVQNVALETLRHRGGTAEPAELLPGDDALAEVGAGVAGFLGEAYLAGLRDGAQLVGVEAPSVQPPTDLGSAFAADLAVQVREPLSATLRMGLAAGEGLQGLSDRLGAVFGDLKHHVAEELSTGHLMAAYEAGMLESWRAAGIAARRWVLGREPRCPEGRCRHNDQHGSAPLGEPFPSGHDHPPVHAGCACTTIPIVESA